MQNLDDSLTLTQFAEAAHISVAYARRLVRTGQVVAHRQLPGLSTTHGRLRIPRTELARLLGGGATP